MGKKRTRAERRRAARSQAPAARRAPVRFESTPVPWTWCAIPLAVFGACALLFSAPFPEGLRTFPLDDAWIHRVYARSMAFGQGFAYNAGQPETGATSPLWIAISAPAHWLEWLGGHAVVLAVKGIGLALGAVAVASLFGLTFGLFGSVPGAVLAGGILAADPRLHFAALSGMEVVLLVALWLETARAVLSGRWLPALALLFLMPLARPEAVLLIPFGVGAIALTVGLQRSLLSRPPHHWAWVVLPGTLWLAYCKAVSGRWLPTTFYEKARAGSFDAELLETAWTGLTQHGWASTGALWVGAIALVVATRGVERRRGLAAGLLLIAGPLVYLAAVAGSREVRFSGYYWVRWMDPASLVLTGALGIGLGGAVAVLTSKSASTKPASGPVNLHSRPARTVGIGALALALAWALPSWHSDFDERRRRLASDGRAIHLLNVAAAEWLAENTPADALVGAHDAGAIRYFSRRRTLDLVGLNYADLAFGRTDRATLLSQIDWIVAWPAVMRWYGVEDRFDVREVLSIPVEEYTVCECPGQATLLVGERRP